MNGIVMDKHQSLHPLYLCLEFMGFDLKKIRANGFDLGKKEMHTEVSLLLNKNNIKHNVVDVYDNLDAINLFEYSLAHWNLNHFVVVIGIYNEGIKIWDPYLGYLTCTCMEFMEFIRKPGYTNKILSFKHSDILQKNVLKVDSLAKLALEKREEKIVFNMLAPLAYFLERFGGGLSRIIINGLVYLWDKTLTPGIMTTPQRNYQLLLKEEHCLSRELARKNISELALNVGRTEFMMNALTSNVTIRKIKKYLSLNLSANSDTFQGQCIVELVHLYDPISAVYNTLQRLPAGRDVVIYGNPWSSSMIGLCEKVILAKSCSLHIIAPAENMSFLKLMKRVKNGAHVIMFADGNPIFISSEATGTQLSRSFGECELWGRKAFLTLTGAVLAEKVNGSLYIGGITNVREKEITFKCANNDGQKLPYVMINKALIVQGLISANPEGWIFSRNAEVYFHEYSPVFNPELT